MGKRHQSADELLGTIRPEPPVTHRGWADSYAWPPETEEAGQVLDIGTVRDEVGADEWGRPVVLFDGPLPGAESDLSWEPVEGVGGVVHAWPPERDLLRDAMTPDLYAKAVDMLAMGRDRYLAAKGFDRSDEPPFVASASWAEREALLERLLATRTRLGAWWVGRKIRRLP